MAASAGDTYTGGYHQGHRHGHGTFIWRKGGEATNIAKYVGEWRDNEMHGEGTLTYPDGSQHIKGQWDKGQRVGNSGHFQFKAGHSYKGERANSTFNNLGEVSYAEGDKYEGHWAHGERQGQGQYRHAKGDVYHGDWVKDRREGQGKFEFRDGGRYEGRWHRPSPDAQSCDRAALVPPHPTLPPSHPHAPPMHPTPAHPPLTHLALHRLVRAAGRRMSRPMLGPPTGSVRPPAHQTRHRAHWGQPPHAAHAAPNPQDSPTTAPNIPRRTMGCTWGRRRPWERRSEWRLLVSTRTNLSTRTSQCISPAGQGQHGV